MRSRRWTKNTATPPPPVAPPAVSTYKVAFDANGGTLPKGKAMAADNLPLVVGGAVALVALYCLVSKLVMKGNAK